MSDFLLQMFFEKPRWETAIQTGFEKQMKRSLLKELCTTEARLKLYRKIQDGNYVIEPPHEARIPKEDGSYRTVYVNENTDRIILSIVNDMFFDLCPEKIHPNCLSYQKHIGCGKIVQKVSNVIQHMEQPVIGVKIDLSKYFDSVPIRYIDEIFNSIEVKYGQSKLLNIIKTYYHTDTVIDINKNIVQKYSSLRQGCAIAAFLADAVLYDIDKAVSELNVCYFRYSDDILIVGEEWQTAYDLLQKMLAEKELVLNPKKVEILYKNRWFKFLGFNIKNNAISLSGTRVKSFQKEIELRTIKGNMHDMQVVLKNVNSYLYKGDGTYSWATSVLPVINVEKDIHALNAFVMDAIRAAVTRKTRIGGLGVNKTGTEQNITRGLGKNVRSNREKIPKIPNYMTVMCMRNAIVTAKPVYDTLVRQM